ncbi:hypothetical protein RZN05_17170 [Sphingomonas sp. HF-S4]|uniref:Uncharacterized protein n=1 Tax=Sphingomonas agrestis TaxID=3080540 RepID=A0ABU3YBI1_9SPHN|nr:hypothetical protein [Sphingomonas sp. HF-S4]MDV3458731.1 hypothetical protein [Sphingomonas sp. HF-S4]
MVGSEDRPNRMMWFMAGAVTMAMYMMGPHAILAKGYDLAESAALWVHPR